MNTIAQLNDRARTALGVGSILIQTDGINALPAAQQSHIREQVERFDDFNADNDPHSEHDFGVIAIGRDERVFWKIDYYDRTMTYSSEDPSDPTQTTRVLTIMLASEY